MTQAPPIGDARHTATGKDLRDALVAASAALDANAERINDLNVFPVPDGDTGTNMSLTLRAVADAVRQLPDTAPAHEVAAAAARAALLGARGNSGVILSQLLHGFAQGLAGHVAISPAAVAEALRQASQSAYQAVSKPVEGTILTVARRAAEAAAEAANRGHDLLGLLRHTADVARQAVAETPSQLETLRKARVVDSGGEGYRVLLEGVWASLAGHHFEDVPAAAARHVADLTALDHDAHDGYGFCTEVLVEGCRDAVPAVRQSMEALGDSVLVVGDAQLLRVHVHTLRPGQALEWAVDHGTLVKVKVENMQRQAAEFAASAAADTAPPENGEPAPTLPLGVVAVAAGEGLKEVFRSLGAQVVEGGQSMNPSVQDLLAAIQRAGFQDVIVLPNNKNVVLTARQVQGLAAGRVMVVPTETVPQGIGALLAFNFDGDLDTNATAMQQAAHAIHTVEVTRAVRDAEVNGLHVQAGQALGIYDGTVVIATESLETAARQAMERAPLDGLEILTIYHGLDADATQAQALAAEVRHAHDGLAVEVVYGGQPHYPYVISLE